ncbi:MAG: tryptophan--tRNA ligase, partial [archaeon]
MAEEEFTVTPWEIEGKVDYEKLIKQFGTTELNKQILEKLRLKTKSKKLHHFFTRGFIYSHRDLEKIIDNIDKNNFFIYTGRGPSGQMHIGHLIPFMITKWFQDEFDCNVYIAMADDEKFAFKEKLTFEEMATISADNFKDISAIDFNTDKTFFFSDIEFISKLYPIALKFAKKTTFSTAKGVFGFTNDNNIGQIIYPVIQVAPTALEDKYCLIPAGIDQDPY